MKKIIKDLFKINFFKPSILRLFLMDLFKNSYKIQPNLFHIQRAIDWLNYAHSKTNDGGVSFGYSLKSGWAPSYPETSGYIIPTFIDYYNFFHNDLYKKKCEVIADWECSIQLKNGGFQSGVINQNEKPAIFNTGQIILGLIKAFKELKSNRYLDSAIKAGHFLVKNQESNGNWVKYCYKNKPHTYNVRTAWALLELSKITDNNEFKNSAIKNLNWALSQKFNNYWFKNNDPTLEKRPLLHFISYTIRGFLEAGLILEDNEYIQVAFESSKRILNYYIKNEYLPARFNSNWESNDYFSCLTGVAQLSIIWLKLYELFKDNQFLINAVKLNNYLKSKQVIDKRFKAINGAIKGSDPIWGNYMRFTFLSWAAKFFCDALILENRILKIN